MRTIKDIQKGLREREFKAEELIEEYLQKEDTIDAFLSFDKEGALEKAKEIDQMIAKGESIPSLAGVPFGIKDAILVEGLKCTAGSKILENYTASYEATCIKRLKEAGAIILGKTNMDEFAMGSSTEHSAFKSTKNPHDVTRVPGGSSGGSAASVAFDSCCCSLGSDTGGSIRQPSSFCGVVGLKPTYGAVSRYGLIAYASSLDQIGPMAKNVSDIETIFDIIKGRDEKDSTSVDLEDTNSDIDLKNLKIGIPKEYFQEGLEKEVKDIIEDTIQKVEKQGAIIKEISLPHLKYALACYYIIATSEASANLARFDGVRYGLSVKGDNLIDDYFKTRGQGFGDEVKKRIMLGAFCLSSGYYDDYYLKAQKVRTLIKRDFEKAFEMVDVIFSPVSPFPAFKLKEKMKDPLKMYLADIYTISVNLAGLPALSLPVGKIGKLPVGLQIIGDSFKEKDIFNIAKLIEQICLVH